MVNVSTYEVDDDFALAMLFKQFDDRRSARGCADISGSFQNSVPVLREIPKGVGKIGIEGIAWYRWEAQRAPVQSGDDIYSLFFVEEYHQFLLWLGELSKEGIGHELKSRAVIASLYATYSANFGAQKEDARLFWALVARGGVEKTTRQRPFFRNGSKQQQTKRSPAIPGRSSPRTFFTLPVSTPGICHGAARP
jgi:hypothetical protein